MSEGFFFVSTEYFGAYIRARRLGQQRSCGQENITGPGDWLSDGGVSTGSMVTRIGTGKGQ